MCIKITKLRKNKRKIVIIKLFKDDYLMIEKSYQQFGNILKLSLSKSIE